MNFEGGPGFSLVHSLRGLVAPLVRAADAVRGGERGAVVISSGGASGWPHEFHSSQNIHSTIKEKNYDSGNARTPSHRVVVATHVMHT